ncbi:MAG: hypothetical protein QOH29_1502, partial [Actinomycetota bacterium]|nr:hypothetical protein [Actinomycetota bacterium]
RQATAIVVVGGGGSATPADET